MVAFNYPPRNAPFRAFYGLFNLAMRLTGRGFRGFAHPPSAMLAVLEGRGLRQTYEHHGRIWQVTGHERAS